MRSNQSHAFSMVPSIKMPRSMFMRPHAYKTTFDAGWLVPFYVDEAVPGDTFKCKSTVFARLATPIFPIMDNLFIDTFYFSVPNRLLWQPHDMVIEEELVRSGSWERFMGEQTDPGDSTDFVVPICVSPASTGYPIGSLQDYMGLPVGVKDLQHNNLHLRAYNLIWNKWFRHQDLQDSVEVPTDDGPDDPSDFVLLRRNKRHDYFTSCFPLLWPW